MPGESKEKYINPYTDFGFKKLFGTEMNKDLLISFLNSLFCHTESEIEDVQYLNGENLGDGYGDRRSIFDVYCMAKDGSRFIVEMQKAEQAEIAKYTNAERQQYEASLKEYWDYTSTMETAFRKGKKEGEELGMEKGMEKGRQEEKTETVRKMKAKGYDTETIAEITGLAIEEIDLL